ncbi:MAG: hypothetical protein U9P07_11645 [Pseudomonadota bacterium]|nr:hypothetical protein [Pseudomonadota bacterium]
MKKTHWQFGCRYAGKDAVKDIRRVTCKRCKRIWLGRVRRLKEYRPDDWRDETQQVPNIYTSSLRA